MKRYFTHDQTRRLQQWLIKYSAFTLAGVAMEGTLRDAVSRQWSEEDVQHKPKKPS